MLYPASVTPNLLELIKSLQGRNYLSGFHLVGGTALSLVLNHRKSDDIDLFSNFDFDAAGLLENLHIDYPFQIFSSMENTLKGSIFDIKVDILAHRYKYLEEPKTFAAINMLSLPDLVAMKLNAISTSGQRSKDFIDIYYLLEKYDLKNMLSFYKEKYDQQNETFLLKSLIYFDDVDLSDWPVLIKNPRLKWTEIKKKMEKTVLNYIHKSE
jgi:hypothetical protein